MSICYFGAVKSIEFVVRPAEPSAQELRSYQKFVADTTLPLTGAARLHTKFFRAQPGLGVSAIENEHHRRIRKAVPWRPTNLGKARVTERQIYARPDASLQPVAVGEAIWPHANIPGLLCRPGLFRRNQIGVYTVLWKHWPETSSGPPFQGTLVW